METQPPQSPRKQEMLVTQHGNIKVSIVGKPSRPAMITYHDIGLNNRACFNSFIKHHFAEDMMEGFCVYNIDAPGQETGATEMGANDAYPKLEELADQIQEVVNHYGIQKFIGLGVGVGATVLIHYAAKYPSLVKGLILLSPAVRKMGWIEWSYFKAISAALKVFGMSDWAKGQLLSRYYGSKTLAKNKELTDATEGALERMNAVNVSKFMDAFMTMDLPSLTRNVESPKMDAKLQVKKYLHQKAQRLAEPRLDYPKMQQKEVVYEKEAKGSDQVRRIPDPELVQILKNLISGGGVLQRQIAEAVNISQTKMSQFLKGAERKRGWKTLERNLHTWISKNCDKENMKANALVSAGKTDSDSASPSKIPNVYQIQQDQSSEGKSDASSEESCEELDSSTNAGTCPQSPAAANPHYNCWTKTNGTTEASIHDSVLGITPSEDATGFHSWESFSLNDMFS